MDKRYQEGDLVVIIDGWHDFSCDEGQIGIVLGTHLVPRTLGEGHCEYYDLFLILLIDGKKLSISVDAVRHLEEDEV